MKKSLGQGNEEESWNKRVEEEEEEESWKREKESARIRP